MEGRKPKYMELVDWVRERVDTGEYMPGHRILSENELSAKFHMSRQTVRRAITVLEEDGLVESRRGSGTYINNNFNFRNGEGTMNIAVITTYVEEYIFPSIIQEIEKAVSAEGYTIQMAFSHNSAEKERSVLQNLLDKELVDGIIIEPVKSCLQNFNKDLYEQLLKRNIPILFLNSYYEHLKIPHVSMDDIVAAETVTEYLTSIGHKKIGGIFKSDDGQGRRRYQGYVKSLHKAGLTLRDERVLWVDTEDMKEMQMESKRVLRRLRDCTACVCYNDVIARELERICRKNGMEVPEDMSIVGIDNSEIARIAEVPLTTANNPLKDLGRIAGENMLRLIKGEKFNATAKLEPELVIRKSTKVLEQ